MLIVGLLALRGGAYDLVARQQFFLVLWWGIGIAFLLGWLPVATPARELRLGLVVLAGLAAWTAISLVWTESAERTVDELARTLGYAGIVVLAVSTLSRDTWRAAAAGLCVAVAGITVLALTSRLLPEAFPEVRTNLLDGERLSYPFEYWNAVAGWAAMALAVGLAWSTALRQPWLRALSLALVPIAGLAIYLTYSRGGLLVGAVAVVVVLSLSVERWTVAIHASVGLIGTAAAVLAVRSQPEIAEGTGSEGALLVVVVLALAGVGCGVCARATRRGGRDSRGRDSRKAGWRVGAAVVASAAIALGAGALLASREPGAESSSRAYGRDADDPAARLLTTDDPRRQIWESAWSAWESAPLGGIGPGTFEYWWARSGSQPELVRDAHSLYLEFLAELGIPGLLLLAGFLLVVVRTAVRLCKQMRPGRDRAAAVASVAILAVLLVQAGFDWMWELTAVGAVGISAGLIVAAAGSTPRRRSRRFAAWRLGVVVAATVAGAIQLPGLISTERLRDSRGASVLGLDESAEESAGDAIFAAPWAASPYAARGFSALLSGDLAAAREDALDAIEREPTNWRHRLLLVQVEAAAGNEQEEQSAREELHRLRPGA